MDNLLGFSCSFLPFLSTSSNVNHACIHSSSISSFTPKYSLYKSRKTLQQSASKNRSLIQSVGYIPEDQVIVDLEKPFASGSFGQVYFGKASATDTPLVIKVPNLHPMADTFIETERYMYTKISSALKVRYWPQFLGYLKIPSVSKTVLVFRKEEQSQTLDWYLKRKEFNTLYTRLGITQDSYGSVLKTSLFNGISLQLLNALQHLHTRGNIIHRDVKPSNVLVCEDEEYPLKLIDFGSSCENRGFIRKGLMNTSFDPIYTAPEQKIDGWNSAGERFDVYSAGLIGLSVLFPSMTSESAVIELKKYLEESQFSIAAWLDASKRNPSRIGFATLSEIYAVESDPIGYECFQLIQDMLKLKPQDRPSAKEAIQRLQKNISA
uniref:Protein kinase domain-containing protein n=1 Tax=Timspurckia oligopyrenoides TaxID=708627 RepID=A0A7S0ZBN7_9RHOD|mmetsp:Transcript_11517/g.20829  ORF Transcript_11517/g.20829 Transcript_11517/m.20829 type:complete len:379 (+) Transcript_11517:169-1305(+)